MRHDNDNHFQPTVGSPQCRAGFLAAVILSAGIVLAALYQVLA